MIELYDNLKPILVVDDDYANNILLCDLLEVEGYQALSARNGKEAIELASTHHPALMLIDLIMPIMDGYETIAYLRGMEEFKTLPIIAVTAVITEDIRIECFVLGCTSYVIKP